MTAEHLASAIAALDSARLALEALEASPCGDDEVDEAITDALADIEANIGALRSLSQECV
jgi:hypothetical protein